MNNINVPPRLAELIFRIFLTRYEYEHRTGELNEVYEYICSKDGRLKAVQWYWIQLFKSLPSLIINSIYWGGALVRNYMLITIRNLKNNKGYSFINIAGLAVGMACFLLILLWVQDELSHDRFHTNIDRLYRVTDYEQYSSGEDYRWAVNPPALGPVLKDEFPEIIEFTRCEDMGEKVIKYGDSRFNESGLIFADQSLFQVFTFPLIKGEKNTCLIEPNSIVITKSTALKYFGENDPVGKILRIDDKIDYIVTAIAADVPGNSHIKFDFVVPFESIKEFGRILEGFNSYYAPTYVMLAKNSDYLTVSDKIEHIIKKHDNESIVELSLQPFADIHLYSGEMMSSEEGDIAYVYIFSIIAVFILLTACINFMNLSTARSGRRAKEVGLRKVIGAGRKEIIYQFYGESIFLSSASLLFAVIMVYFLLPTFNTLSGKELQFDLLQNKIIILMLIGTALFTGIISGSYPALYLSSFQPVKVLGGSLRTGISGKLFRKVLVSFQFVLTISLLIGTIIINNQLHFIKDQKLGFNKDHTICIRLKGETSENIERIKNDISNHKDVLSSTAVSFLPSHVRTSFIISEWEGQNPEEQFLSYLLHTDYDFINTMKIDMAEGRFYSREFVSDTVEGVVVNEAAVKTMGMESPLGKAYMGGKIIGVVKDYHFRSLHSEISPLTIIFSKGRSNYLLVKINSSDLSNTIEYLEESWSSLVPEFPFEFQFLDEHIDNQYRADQRIENIINSFTFLAILIAGLGLFGLAAYTAEQRTREIGIRKVLGSSVYSIVVLLSKEFTRWVLLANVIAWPVSYFIMNKWLEGFAYRTELDCWIFFLSGGTALTISLLTVIYQAVKAAIANPIESLRNE